MKTIGDRASDVGEWVSDIAECLVSEMGFGVVLGTTAMLGISLGIWASPWVYDVSTHFNATADNQKTVIAGPANAATANCVGAAKANPPGHHRIPD